jgi:hypothetical protein
VSRLLLVIALALAAFAVLPVSSSVASEGDKCYYVGAQTPDDSYGVTLCPGSENVFLGLPPIV